MIVWARPRGRPAGPSARQLPDLPGGELTDGVVTLRPMTEEDGPITYQLRSLPDVSGRSVVSTPMDPAVVTRQCAESVSRWLAGQRAEMTVRRRRRRHLPRRGRAVPLGAALREAMIGYSLTPAARGKGYAARAAGWSPTGASRSAWRG